MEMEAKGSQNPIGTLIFEGISGLAKSSSLELIEPFQHSMKCGIPFRFRQTAYSRSLWWTALTPSITSIPTLALNEALTLVRVDWGWIALNNIGPTRPI